MNDSGTCIDSDGSAGTAKVIPLSFRDSWKPLIDIRTLLFFVVKQDLDDKVLRDALEKLIREHLPILGTRIHVAKKTGQPEYHIPATFEKDYELFRWSSVSIESTLDEANVLKPTAVGSSISFYPSIVELETAWTPSGWPLDRRQAEDNCPLLLVHLTHYRDATVVATNLPHSVADQTGYATIIESWIDLVRGRSLPPFSNISASALDGANMTDKEMRMGKGDFRIQTKQEVWTKLMGFIPELVRQQKEERRILLFATSLLDKLRSDMNQQIANDSKTVVLTNNDVLVALLLKASSR
ncbi:Alpha-1,2-mannosidase family protein [Fusarium austroafricanum]|uniref:Alpha-1,2-mannosidase family protein n=1 Tax=Fusarium austroafricanum TaxID=2364996 RepID=A0A8H4KVT4_9HYPO|nr:Alpha-1,2-mannosidase family protein [Fusarium austroafricanum]